MEALASGNTHETHVIVKHLKDFHSDAESTDRMRDNYGSAS